jgi:hypothetical protein
MTTGRPITRAEAATSQPIQPAPMTATLLALSIADRSEAELAMLRR